MDRSAPSRPTPPPDDWWTIFDPRHSLRARAALLLGGSTAVFVWALAGVCGAFLREGVERRLSAEFETLAFQLSDKFDRVIHQRYHEIQLAAAVGPFRSSAGTPADRRRLLESVQDASRDFAWIGFADTSGQIRAATRGLLEGTSVVNRPWFVLGREKPFAASLQAVPVLAQSINPADEERSTRFIELAVPVTAENGQALGVLGAGLNWDWSREVQLSVVPEASRRDRIGVTVYAANGDVLLDSGGSGWTLPPEAPAITDPRRFRGSLVEATTTGTTYVTGFARSRGYREYRGFGWLVTVRQPRELALAPARELQHRITAWGLVLAVALGVVGWFAAGRLARRMRGISSAARRIREGDVLTVMPRPQGGAEIDQMCAALGSMVEDLRAQPGQKPPATPPR
jgi:HAMP domain-containing protein